MRSLELNGTNYYEGSKCPACSSEVDKGGRMKIKKRKRLFLKCDYCSYTILSKETVNKKEKYFDHLRSKAL